MTGPHDPVAGETTLPVQSAEPKTPVPDSSPATAPQPSPVGAVRERPVPCRRCFRDTYNHSGLCTPCLVAVS